MIRGRFAAPTSSMLATPEIGYWDAPEPGSWRDDDVLRYHGATVTCYPPAGIALEKDVLKRIHREVDSRIRPLWATKVWEHPNGALTKRTYLCIGYEVTDPKSRLIPASGLLMPVHPTGLGFMYRQPIVVKTILDGLEEEAEAQGVPPSKVIEVANQWRNEGRPGRTITLSEVFAQLKQAAAWLRAQPEYENATLWERVEAKRMSAQMKSAEQETHRKFKEEQRARWRSNRLQRRMSAGGAVFIDSRAGNA